MAILAPAMVTIQTAAGTVKETDNGVSFFGVTDLKTGMCSNRAEWVYKLQDKVTEEELAEIVNTIQCVFSIPNRYVKKTYKIQQGTQIAFLPTMGLSLLLVGLPSSAIRNSKYPELVQRAYELANKICRDLNKKILKERGVTVSVRQHGMQAGAMFRTSYHLPELHFDFCPQQTQLPPANVVGENILVAELAAWQNLLRNNIYHKIHDVSKILEHHMEQGKLIRVFCKYHGLEDRDSAWESAYQLYLEDPNLIKRYCKKNNLQLPTPPEED